MWSEGKTPYNLTEFSRVLLALLCVHGLNRPPTTKGGPSKYLDTKYLDTKYLDTKYLDTKYLDTKYLDTKSETLTQFQSLGLKGFMFTPDTTDENKTYAEQSGPGPLPDRGAPVICTGFPLRPCRY